MDLGGLIANGLKAGLWGLAGGVEAAARSGIESAINIVNTQSGKELINASHFGPLGSIFYWEDFYKNVKDANQELGISNELAKNMEDNFQQALEGYVAIGGKVEELTSAYKAFVNETSTNRLLNPEDLQTLAKFRLAFGEGYEQIFGTLALYGKSIEDTNKSIGRSFELANKIGLNAAKTLAELNKNIGLLDRFSFDRGIDALSEMVMLSERYKINMSSAAGFVDKSLDLDSVMEMSAQLMVLGGEFSKLGDPFTLMATARSNPELLIQKISELAGAYAHLNEQTGTFTVDAYGMDIIRQFSQISGIATEEISKAAKIGRMRIEVETQIAPNLKALEDYEQIVDKISAGAYFKNGVLGIDIKTPDGKTKFTSVASVDPKDLETLSAVNQNIPLEDITKDLISTNQTLIESINALIETFKRYVIPETMYQEARRRVEPAIQNMSEGIGNNDVMLSFKEYFERTDKAIIDNLISLGSGMQNMLTNNETPNFYNTLVKPDENYESQGFFSSYFGGFLDAAKAWKETFTNPMQFFGLTSPKEDEVETERVNENTTTIKYEQLKQFLITQGGKMDVSSNRKIEFGELSGMVKVMADSGVKMGDIDMNKLWQEIKPLIEEKIKTGVYDNLTNEPKNNPARQTPFY